MSDEPPPADTADEAAKISVGKVKDDQARLGRVIGLKYDIAIHLPATKDIEVYNAIFKSLKEHLVD